MALLAGCGSKASPAATFERLESGEVARVGPWAIQASFLGQVARVQDVAPRDALVSVTNDALLAERARSTGLADAPAVRVASDTALARNVVLRLAEAAQAAGPPTDAELATVRVIHALVPRSGPATDRARIAMAAAIRQAVQGAASAEDFERRANGVPHAGMLLKVERVPEFGADGESSDGPIDPSFVAAAFALRSEQSISPVIETPFGWHVLDLVSRVAPDASSLEARRRALAGAVVSMRAREAFDSLLAERRARTEVSTAPEADEWTAMAIAAEP